MKFYTCFQNVRISGVEGSESENEGEEVGREGFVPQLERPVVYKHENHMFKQNHSERVP